MSDNLLEFGRTLYLQATTAGFKFLLYFSINLVSVVRYVNLQMNLGCKMEVSVRSVEYISTSKTTLIKWARRLLANVY